VRTIRIVPWQNDLIRALAGFLAGLPRPDFEDALILFPHHRPRRYLRRELAAHPGLAKPCLPPETWALSDFVTRLRADLCPTPLKPAGLLDQVGLLYACVERLRQSGEGLLAGLPLDPGRFFPWGVRLASLCEELLRQGVAPRDLAHMQGEVTDFAAALLEQLGRIFRGYLDALAERDWTTPGLDHRLLAERLPEVRTRLAGRLVLAAGFAVLSGVEEALLKDLWDAGGLVLVWHTDPALARGEPGHFAARPHQRWLADWSAKARLLEEPDERAPCRVRFVEGFDLHSQLHALQRELAALPELERTAVILPAPGALVPLLHHLPPAETNISLGYPLERSSLRQLVECVLSLQERRSGQGFFWRDLVNLVRHPLLKLLEAGEGLPLRGVLHQWEHHIRGGEKFQDPHSFRPIYEEVPEASAQRIEALRQEVLRLCVAGFENLSSLAGLARALEALLAALREHGGTALHGQLVDAECLHRLTESVVPQMRGCVMAEEPFEQAALFAVLRQLIAEERVSFEPEPLTGLQVLGVLEARLLSFARVFVLNAVEDHLPGTDPFDPLLPDPVRGLLGLPDARERDEVAAHHFHRLIASAGEAVLLYQAGVVPGLLDGKHVRSRFVEQLLWEIEKREGRILRPSADPPLVAVGFRASPLPAAPAAIPRTPAAQKRLLERLSGKGLAPSLLDDYLRCPKRFSYRYVARVRPPVEVNEEGDRPEFGELVHGVLAEFFAPHLNRPLTPSRLDPEALVARFEEALELSAFFRQMPFDLRETLRAAGRVRLRRFLDHLPLTTIRQLEAKIETDVAVAAPGLASVRVTGRIDRIDEREEGVVILDYKTGSMARPGRGFFADEALWADIRACDPAADPQPELLARIMAASAGVQLPLYLHLYARTTGVLPADACFVELADEGAEVCLFGGKAEPELKRAAVVERTPELTAFLVRHMLTAPAFAPIRGRTCEFCDFRSPCGA
jgi:hypothetical protein